MRIEDLPPIDAVLISHNHFDHLDLPTLRQLGTRGPSAFVLVARCARLLRSQGIESVHELDWGGSLAISGVTIHCVPALHFSARGILDRNKTLWRGYVIEYPESLVFFAVDTAFGSHFAQIREKFYAPQLALLPMGAYEPRWFMSLLTKKGDRLAVSNPEKAGGGGSGPSLATDNLKGAPSMITPIRSVKSPMSLTLFRVGNLLWHTPESKPEMAESSRLCSAQRCFHTGHREPAKECIHFLQRVREFPSGPQHC